MGDAFARVAVPYIIVHNMVVGVVLPHGKSAVSVVMSDIAFREIPNVVFLLISFRGPMKSACIYFFPLIADNYRISYGKVLACTQCKSIKRITAEGRIIPYESGYSIVPY